jgi:hypothetical protein
MVKANSHPSPRLGSVPSLAAPNFRGILPLLVAIEDVTQQREAGRQLQEPRPSKRIALGGNAASRGQ